MHTGDRLLFAKHKNHLDHEKKRQASPLDSCEDISNSTRTITMCNGTGRASQGGRIVILQPVFQSFTANIAKTNRPTLTRGFSLRLDDDGDRSCTTVTIDGSRFSASSPSRASSPSLSEDGSSDEDVGAECEGFSWRGSSFVIQ